MQWYDPLYWTPPFGLGKAGPVGVFTDKNEFTLFFTDKNLPEDSGADPDTFSAQLYKQPFALSGLAVIPIDTARVLGQLPHNYSPVSVQRTPDQHLALICLPDGDTI